MTPRTRLAIQDAKEYIQQRESAGEDMTRQRHLYDVILRVLTDKEKDLVIEYMHAPSNATEIAKKRKYISVQAYMGVIQRIINKIKKSW